MKSAEKKSIVMVNPFECRMWPMHDRIEGHITEETCRAEIESLARHGQLVPVLGRPLRADLQHKVELVYGARRLFVARHINVPLAVDLRELSDREAIVAMDIENRHRRDISPYERGLSYARWLRTGHFRCQDELARTLRVSSSQVSRLLKLAQLPSAIMNVFQHPGDICESWGLKLCEALEDGARRQRILNAARALAELTPRPAAREVFRRLLAASHSGRPVKAKSRDEIFRDDSGRSLFRVRYQRQSVAVLLPLTAVSAQTLASICSSIAKLLKDPKPTAPPSLSKPPARTSRRALEQCSAAEPGGPRDRLDA